MRRAETETIPAALISARYCLFFSQKDFFPKERPVYVAAYICDILLRQIKDYAADFPKSLLRFPGFSLAGFRHLPRFSCLNPR